MTTYSYSRIVGSYHGHMVTEENLTNEMLCDASYIPAQDSYYSYIKSPVDDKRESIKVRCAYCGKRGSGNECKSCGAPL